MKQKIPETPAGAQTVDRACELLRKIARHGPQGGRMLDLCEATGLSRPTVHRILQSLQASGLVLQSAETKRYSLGLGMFELGLTAPNPVARFPQVRSIVEELAASTQDTVYLMLRSHEDVVCIWRAQGNYPIMANIVALGDRRPMGASAAGLCLLSALSEAESDTLIDATAAELPAYCRMTADDVRRHVTQARSNAYSVCVNAVMDGVSAVGMAVPSSYQRPFMSMSVSAITPRIPASRIPELVTLLDHYAKKIAAVTGSDAASR